MCAVPPKPMTEGSGGTTDRLIVLSYGSSVMVVSLGALSPPERVTDLNVPLAPA